MKSSSPVTDLVRVADVLCLTLGIGRGRDYLKYETSEGSMRRLGLKEAALAATAATITEDMEKVVESVDLDADKAD